MIIQALDNRGNCYAFNGESKKALKATMPGNKHGLKLELLVSEYIHESLSTNTFFCLNY